MTSGRIYVTESQIICGSRDGTANVLYPHSSYTHPSTIQCSAATEINSLKSSVSSGKTQVANAITGKGVSASQNDSFATLASKIGQIQDVSSLYFGSSVIETINVPSDGEYIVPSNATHGEYYFDRVSGIIIPKYKAVIGGATSSNRFEIHIYGSGIFAPLCPAGWGITVYFNGTTSITLAGTSGSRTAVLFWYA